jgi:cyanophycinase
MCPCRSADLRRGGVSPADSDSIRPGPGSPCAGAGVRSFRAGASGLARGAGRGYFGTMTEPSPFPVLRTPVLRTPLLLGVGLLLGGLCPVAVDSPEDRAPAAPAAGEPAVGEPGALVIIGGGLSAENEAVYRVILEARQGGGPLCVVGTAGADPEGSSASAVARFARWGGEGAARAHPLSSEDPQAARDPEVLAALAECSGYFFVGGVQSRIVALLRPEREGQPLAPAGKVMMERWREGAVVSGSSAGAAMMSDPMIAGGSSAGAFAHGVGDEGVRLAPGLGFLPELLVDQHFLARGRIGRLLVAALEPGGVPLAAGIDENTALVVRGTELEVVGASGVVMVDAREGAVGGGEGGLPSGAREVRLELLGPGDRFSILPGSVVRPAGDRVTLPAHPWVEWEGPEGGLFEPWVFLHFLDGVGRGSQAAPTPGAARVGMRVEGGFLRFRAGEGFRALGDPDGEGEGVEGSTAGLSVGPILVEVWRGVDP